jgi:hypothetical protein
MTHARDGYFVKTLLRLCLGAALLSACLLLASARPAAAASPCWKTLLNDWYDGRIDNTYPVSCYREAIKHLPTDVQTYSSARDDIERALQSAQQRDRQLHDPVTPSTLVPGSGTKTTTTPAAATPGSTTTTTTGAVSFPGNKPNGGISSLADQLNPASPSSLPIPLLVLGGLAILLVAAGGVGVLVKRAQNRP